MRLSLFLAVTLILALPACQLRPPQPPAGEAVGAFPEAAYRRAERAGEPVYDLRPEASRLRVFVYRAGAFKDLGHNHVIDVRDWRGALVLDPESIDGARLDMRIPVAGLTVDPPALRGQLGGGFATDLESADVADTTANLRGPDLLDAEAHPRIAVTLVDVAGALPRPLLTLRVTVRGIPAEVRVPVAVTRTGERLTAEGRFAVGHTELGLEPFTAAGGALRVAEPIVVEFRLVAERRGS